MFPRGARFQAAKGPEPPTSTRDFGLTRLQIPRCQDQAHTIRKVSVYDTHEESVLIAAEDPDYDAYKRGAFLEKTNRFNKDKPSDVPGESLRDDCWVDEALTYCEQDPARMTPTRRTRRTSHPRRSPP